MFCFVDGMHCGESVGIHVFRIAITCKFSFFIYHLSHSNCIACNNHVSLLTINNSFFLCVYPTSNSNCIVYNNKNSKVFNVQLLLY